MSSVKKTNGQYLTKEQLKATKGFEHLTDEEAQLICDFAKAYAHILLDSYFELKKSEIHESSSERISKVRKDNRKKA